MPMRSRRQTASQIPEVNLVPLMDVLMSVLTFFIIISMNLSSQNILSVDAPSPDDTTGTEQEDGVEPFVIGLNVQGEALLADQPVDQATLVQEVRSYLADHPDGYVRLKADKELDYQEVTRFLTVLRNIGSGRVSLAVE
ncbi:MAG: biopolymer transporter ExbD [Cyanothece sp. SIO2G6]|nr:biopolymer transporter ExbD [Cyanothece sp. SIO2G6]